MEALLLVATALGAIALYLMLPREKPAMLRLGGLLGAFTLAGLFLCLLGMEGAKQGASIFFYLFAAIMVAGAVGVICHPKPVYAALYFVLVSLAGAGIFVLLLAEFMSIVLIIVYAGAILVTYVFVIMLASQSGPNAIPLYDRTSSEPLLAVVVSFVLLGAVLQLIYSGTPARAGINGEKSVVFISGQTTSKTNRDSMFQTATGLNQPEAPRVNADVPVPTELQALGTNLYHNYPLSLELGGVLLTVALVGSVVIARKKAPEDGAHIPIE